MKNNKVLRIFWDFFELFYTSALRVLEYTGWLRNHRSSQNYFEELDCNAFYCFCCFLFLSKLFKVFACISRAYVQFQVWFPSLAEICDLISPSYKSVFSFGIYDYEKFFLSSSLGFGVQLILSLYELRTLQLKTTYFTTQTQLETREMLRIFLLSSSSFSHTQLHQYWKIQSVNKVSEWK